LAAIPPLFPHYRHSPCITATSNLQTTRFNGKRGFPGMRFSGEIRVKCEMRISRQMMGHGGQAKYEIPPFGIPLQQRNPESGTRTKSRIQMAQTSRALGF
jgi:hypothetical protein